MKTFFLFLVGMIMFTPLLWSQGLQDVIVETYYVADANDAADSDGGSLPEGAVTYRIYLDLAPNYRALAIYGNQDHELRISSSTEFFNNEDRGEIFGHLVNDTRLDDNTVALDSWLTISGASDAHRGLLKSEDADGSIIGGPNNDGGSESVSGGLLVNNDPAAGIPLTTADGLFASPPPTNIVSVGLDLTMFEDENSSTPFVSSNGSWANLEWRMDPEFGENKILIAQITTDGDLAFTLNVQILNLRTNQVERYVADNPGPGEFTLPQLTRFPLSDDSFGCTDPTACNFNAVAIQDDGSCLIPIPGCSACSGNTLEIIDTDGNGIPDCDDGHHPACMDPEACNFDPTSFEEDNSLCEYAVDGCTECIFNTLELIDSDGDGICDADDTDDLLGCTSPTACNYNPEATQDNNTCIEPVSNCTFCIGEGLGIIDLDGNGVPDCEDVVGCTFPGACNYVQAATIDDGSCEIPQDFCEETCFNGRVVSYDDLDGDLRPDGCRDNLGCTSPTACNYDPSANEDNGTCIEPVPLCTECDGASFILIDSDGDGICDADEVSGCSDPTACNYNPIVSEDDGSCIIPSPGCTECANGALVLTDADGDGVCDSDEVPGCTSVTACNYDALATDDDGSCKEPSENCTVCKGEELFLVDFDQNGVCDQEQADNSGCKDDFACNYAPDAQFNDPYLCVYPVAGCYECVNGASVLIDADGDGFCDADEITGCTNPDSWNFNPSATEDDGSCVNDPDCIGLFPEITAFNVCTETKLRAYFTGSRTLNQITWFQNGQMIGTGNKVVVPTNTDPNVRLTVEASTADGRCVITHTESFPIIRDVPIEGKDTVMFSEDDVFYRINVPLGTEVLWYATGHLDNQNVCGLDRTALVDFGMFWENGDEVRATYFDEKGCFHTVEKPISIEPTIVGCTSPTACNYNPDAAYDNGSCQEPVEGCTECIGGQLTLIDTDGDGICDGEEILGCTDPEALNFQGFATEDDGSCEFRDPCGGQIAGFNRYNLCFGRSGRFYPYAGQPITEFKWFVNGSLFTTDRILRLPLETDEPYAIRLEANNPEGTCPLVSFDTIQVPAQGIISGPTTISQSQDDVEYSINLPETVNISWGAWDQLDNDFIIENGNSALFDFGPAWESGSVIIAVYTDANGCRQRSTLPIYVHENGKYALSSKMSHLNVFPNPFTEVLHLEIPESSDAVEVQILNMQGHLIYDNFHQGPTDIFFDAKTKPGVYTVRVITEFTTHVTSLTKLN